MSPTSSYDDNADTMSPTAASDIDESIVGEDGKMPSYSLPVEQ